MMIKLIMSRKGLHTLSLRNLSILEKLFVFEARICNQGSKNESVSE